MPITAETKPADKIPWAMRVFKIRAFRIGHIDVGGIQVAGDAGEHIYVRIGDGFGELVRIADFNLVEGSSDHLASS
jgi:hypothetical protein